MRCRHRCSRQKVAETAIAGEEAAITCEIRQFGKGAHQSRYLASWPARRSACTQSIRKGLDSAEHGRIRHCDDGFKGPLTQPQTDGSRRTTLGVKTGLHRAAHLDRLPL
jgi:hypothetical protein